MKINGQTADNQTDIWISRRKVLSDAIGSNRQKDKQVLRLKHMYRGASLLELLMTKQTCRYGRPDIDLFIEFQCKARKKCK